MERLAAVYGDSSYSTETVLACFNIFDEPFPEAQKRE